MSWVNDLASVAGIPAGAATLAVAMYLGCSAAEKAARPEALRDIGRILKDPSWSRSVRPSAIVEQVFVWTFGERHLSWKCLLSCAIASVCCTSAAIVVLHFSTGTLFVSPSLQSDIQNPALIVYYFGGCGTIMIISDYISLAKTRLLVNRLAKAGMGLIGGIDVVALDVFLSAAIALSVSLFLVTLVHITFYSMSGALTRVLYTVLGWVFAARSDVDIFEAIVSPHSHFLSSAVWGLWSSAAAPFTGAKTSSAYSAFLWSTMLTSIWSIATLASTTVIKLLAPLHRFTAWFFDVDKHPVKAIGIVSGALVMVGSFVWTILIHVL